MGRQTIITTSPCTALVIMQSYRCKKVYRVPYPIKECRRDAYPFLGPCSRRCDVWQVRRLTYRYQLNHPRHRAPALSCDWYQIILLTDRSIRVWTTCRRLLSDSRMMTGRRIRDLRVVSPAPWPLHHQAKRTSSVDEWLKQLQTHEDR